MLQERERTIGRHSPELASCYSFTFHHNSLHHKSFSSITTTTTSTTTTTYIYHIYVQICHCYIRSRTTATIHTTLQTYKNTHNSLSCSTFLIYPFTHCSYTKIPKSVTCPYDACNIQGIFYIVGCRDGRVLEDMTEVIPSGCVSFLFFRELKHYPLIDSKTCIYGVSKRCHLLLNLQLQWQKIMKHPIWVPSGNAKKILLGPFPLSWHFQTDNFMFLFTISQDLLLVTWSHPYPMAYISFKAGLKYPVNFVLTTVDNPSPSVYMCLLLEVTCIFWLLDFKKMSLRWSMSYLCLFPIACA